MAKVISFFNNKGGVGKTTTSCNIAAGLSQKFHKRVLYIDLDPQCNSTLLIIGEAEVASCYGDTENQTKTILDIIAPILADEPSIDFDSSYIRKTPNRFSIDLIMGHPKLSSIEDRLGESWVKISGGEIGALRKTNWCYMLIEAVKDQYDYVLIDLGPSLGALNRSALIASDYFVTPMSIDIFSIIGIKNIKEWINSWVIRYERGLENLKLENMDHYNKYSLKKHLDIKSGCIGYTSQSYNSRRNKEGEKRPTAAYENILTRFNAEFIEHMGGFLVDAAKNGNHVLGEIPNMFSLAPLAQQNASPIRDLKSSDGIFGAHFSLAKEYAVIFDNIAEKIIQTTGDSI